MSDRCPQPFADHHDIKPVEPCIALDKKELNLDSCQEHCSDDHEFRISSRSPQVLKQQMISDPASGLRTTENEIAAARRLPPIPILGRSGYRFPLDRKHRRKYLAGFRLMDRGTVHPAGYLQQQPAQIHSDSLSMPPCYRGLENRPPTPLCDLYKHHFYHHRPAKADPTSLSILTTVDFRELEESLSDKSANEFFSSSPCKHRRRQKQSANQLRPLKICNLISKKINRPTSPITSKRPTRAVNHLSTLLIEGPASPMLKQQALITKNRRFSKTVNEVIFPLFSKSREQTKVTAPYSLSCLNNVIIQFPALVSNCSNRTIPTSDVFTARTRRNRMKWKHLPTIQSTARLPSRRLDCGQNELDVSNFLPLLPIMADVSIRNFPSKVKKPKHIVHQLNISENGSTRPTGLPTIKAPRITTRYSTDPSSSYVSRVSTLHHKKKLAAAEDSFKMPNLYPDLSIVGCQFQSLQQQLSEMVDDVIQSTFNTVNALIESSEERLRNLKRSKKRKGAARRLNEQRFLGLCEGSNDDLTDSDEFNSYNTDDEYLHGSDYDSQSNYSSSSFQGNDAGSIGGIAKRGSNRKKKKKRRRKIKGSSSIMKQRSQKQRLIERLKKKGVNVISEAEAMRILMQAKSDINQMKKATQSKDSSEFITGSTTRITKSGRVLKKSKKKSKRAKRRKLIVPTGAEDTHGYSNELQDDEELDSKTKRRRHRRHKYKRKQHKDDLEDNELSDRTLRRKLRYRKRKRRRRRQMGLEDNENELFDDESEGNSDQQWDSISDDTSSYSSYDSSTEDYSDLSEYSYSDENDTDTDDDTTFGDSSDDGGGDGGSGDGGSGNGSAHGGGGGGGKSKRRSKRRMKAKLKLRKRKKLGKSSDYGSNDLARSDSTNEESHLTGKGSIDKALRRNRRRDRGIVDETTAALKLANGSDDSVLEISRPNSTVSKLAINEGRQSQSDGRTQSGKCMPNVQHGFSGSDLHQQRIINLITQNNNSVIMGKIEEEEMYQSELKEEERLQRVRRKRQEELEATFLGDFEMQEAEIKRRRQFEKEARKIVEQEKIEKEQKEQERLEQFYERKEQEQQMIIRKLEKLRNEVEKKQIIHRYHQAVVDQYYDDITMWNSSDYHYIECLMGSEYCQRIMEIDRKKRLEDAIVLEQQLMENFELKRQELLLKLQQAHVKFSEKLSENTESLDLLDQSSKISRAFVTSYFEFVDDKHNFFLLNSFVQELI